MSDPRSMLLTTVSGRIATGEMRSTVQTTALVALTGAGFDISEAGRDLWASIDALATLSARRSVLRSWSENVPL